MPSVLETHPLKPGEWLAVDLMTLRTIRVVAEDPESALLLADGCLVPSSAGTIKRRRRWYKLIRAGEAPWICKVGGPPRDSSDTRDIRLLEQMDR